MFVFQEPLNSSDDVSDEEDQELFDTENVVVCQYDKVLLTHTWMHSWRIYCCNNLLVYMDVSFIRWDTESPRMST